MTSRQVETSGRAAQRRRTRSAIVGAATALISAGESPTIDDIAAAAEVSRRTVYLYFPTLDQLLLDATTGALSAAEVDEVLPSGAGPDSVEARVDALVTTLVRTAPDTLPLGRKIIKLTVDRPTTESTELPLRGYRRRDWIRRAVEPLADSLSHEQQERLVAALAVVTGWEAMVVLQDVCGLPADREEDVLRWAARSLVASMRAELGHSPPP